MQEKRAAEAAERALEEARELKDYRSQLTFKASHHPLRLHVLALRLACLLPVVVCSLS